jgi:hypothetical protein
MKAMLIPIAIGLLAGLGGGSGYAYMKASATFVADSTRRAAMAEAKADSAAHDSVGHAASGDSASLAEQALMTPADSLRALEAARQSGTVHAPAVHGAPEKGPAAVARAAAEASHAAPEAKPAPVTKPAPDAKPVASTANAAASAKAARDQALQTTLPEARLAKIFGAMTPKDAAKVLEQMTDGDIRAILAMMSDRQAAAILSTLPAARSAAITKGVVKP